MPRLRFVCWMVALTASQGCTAIARPNVIDLVDRFVIGALPEESVVDTLLGVGDQLHACLQGATPQLRIVIGQSGDVLSASTFGTNQVVGSCVVGLVTQLKFPPPDRGVAVASLRITAS